MMGEIWATFRELTGCAVPRKCRIRVGHFVPRKQLFVPDEVIALLFIINTFEVRSCRRDDRQSSR
jgi:hypothetical protein